MIEEIKKEGFSIDILINNAGVCKVGELEVKIPTLKWAHECLRVNLLAQI